MRIVQIHKVEDLRKPWVIAIFYKVVLFCFCYIMLSQHLLLLLLLPPNGFCIVMTHKWSVISHCTSKRDLRFKQTPLYILTMLMITASSDSLFFFKVRNVCKFAQEIIVEIVPGFSDVLETEQCFFSGISVFSQSGDQPYKV